MKDPFITRSQAENLTRSYPTPFYIYSEAEIRETARSLHKAFSWNKDRNGSVLFKEYFAVKATPTPGILKILKEEGCGFDCATVTELKLIDKIFGKNRNDVKVMYSGNVNPDEDFIYARNMQNAVINLDDITHIEILERLSGLPETVSLRYNPGYFDLDKKYNPPMSDGIINVIGEPADSKYGLTTEQLFEAFKILKSKGVRKFGMHAFLASNTLTNAYYPSLAGMLFETAVRLKKELGVELSFINLSGGIGIAYRPEEQPNDISVIGEGVRKEYLEKLVPEGLGELAVFSELGRFMLASSGALVTRAIREKHTHKEYIGVDASASNLMRPAVYGAYHHISVLGKETAEHVCRYDITGGLCENSDKFAVDRMLPKIITDSSAGQSGKGDLIYIHDCGAHGHSMGYNYNGKLRSAEILIKENGDSELIRRAETPEDYFRCMIF